MPLGAGTRLGPYEIAALLGAGGMGEVYRAVDTNLGREVAVKVLPDAFAQDAGRVARFDREAKTLAALNHPNIAAVYGLETGASTTALVMELVEGPTLTERIAWGPIAIDEALSIAKQIAEALEAAHEQGITHRDLKPSNVKVRPDGMVKLLDFGLAKPTEPSAALSPAALEVATITTPTLTQAGVVLGTAAYMSPEQVRGKPADKRTDIWAFGCVLFEMLTGERAFPGTETADVLAAVLMAQPAFDRLPPAALPHVRALLERCLEKDSRRRYHAAADVRLDLERSVREQASMPVRWLRATLPRTGNATRTAAGIAFVAAAAGLTAWSLRAPTPLPVTRLSHVLPDGQAFARTGRSLLAVAPDGASLVYVADDRLFLRRLAGLDALPIPGSEGAPSAPFFSPDGQFLAFWDERDRQLKRIASAGGPPVSIVASATFSGGSWGDDGSIVYGQEDGIWRVPATAPGAPVRLVAIEPFERVHHPQMLPGHRAVLFTLLSTAIGSGPAAWDQARVVAHSLDSDVRTVLVEGSDARYVASGHLVFARSNTLFALAFDPSSISTRGQALPVVDGLRRADRGPGSSATANYDLSDDGLLAYVETSEEGRFLRRQLVAVDRRGQVAPLLDEQRAYWRPQVSPDGRRLAVEVMEGAAEQIWVADLSARTAIPLAFDGAMNIFPAWTPDSRSVLFRSNRTGVLGLYRQRADGTEDPALVLRRGGEVVPTSVSRDGVVAFTDGAEVARRTILTVGLHGDPVAEFLATPAMEHMAMFAPDGRWLAYVSNESGRDEVYVRPYPRRAGIGHRVSVDGGTAPVWARDGNELFYRDAAGDLMAIRISTASGFSAGPPQRLFRVIERFRTSNNTPAYDVLADGRFVMVTEPPVARSPLRRIIVVQNWFDELRRLVPAS